MPKETITPSGNYRTETPDGGRYVPQPEIEVSWMRDLAHVQIGVTTPAEQDGHYHLVDVLYGDEETREKIGRVMWAQIVGRLQALGAIAASDVAAGETLDPGIAQGIGREVLDAVTGSDSGFYGYYTSLTERRDLNHFIRQLKRARDGAFGRDE